MNYAWALIDRAFFVRWRRLEPASLDKILVDLAHARRAVGQPLIYTSITPADLPVPNAEQRAALNQFAEKAREHLEIVHLVLEGDGFKHNVQRAALTTIQFLAVRGNPVPTLIHKTVDQALAKIAPSLSRSAADLARTLRTRGLLDAQPATTSP